VLLRSRQASVEESLPEIIEDSFRNLVCFILPYLLSDAGFFSIELMLLRLCDMAAIGVLVGTLLLVNAFFFGSQLSVMATQIPFIGIRAAAQIVVTMEYLSTPGVLLGKFASKRRTAAKDANQTGCKNWNDIQVCAHNFLLDVCIACVTQCPRLGVEKLCGNR